MKKLIIILALTFSFLTLQASTANALQCLRTSRGLVFINGRKVTRINFSNRHYITVSCTLKRAGYMYWTGGTACENAYIYGRNPDFTSFRCKILKVR